MAGKNDGGIRRKIIGMHIFAAFISLLIIQVDIQGQTDWKNWPSLVPAGCPFPISKKLTGITFTGQVRHVQHGDTWYPSWGSDDRLYSTFADGGGAIWPNQGFGIMTGNDPMTLQIASTGIIQANNIHSPYAGLYPSATLFYNGIWFWGQYTLDDLNGACRNWCSGGPFIGFWTSVDTGKTWIYPPHNGTSPIFGESGKNGAKCKIMSPHVVDFGKNMQYSPDGKMYMVAHGATRPQALSNWIGGDQVYLLRCMPQVSAVNDSASWEFFAGKDVDGADIWTHDFQQIRPLLEWEGQMGCVTVTYDAPLSTYLMCFSRPADGFNCTGDYDSYILEAPAITGPWSMVHYLRQFGSQAYFDNIPSKFISSDGLQAWLLYSANFAGGTSNPPGSGYGITWAEFRIAAACDTPRVVSVTATTASTVIVTFCGAVDSISAKNSANYSVDNGAMPVSSAVLDRNGNVELHFSTALAEGAHQLSVSNVRSNANPPITIPANSVTTFNYSYYKNIAPRAVASASSVHPDYSVTGVNDSVVDGFPGNISREWASNGQAVGAWVTLTWSAPVTIKEIRLFDRPNNLDQVLTGTLSFSSGSDVSVGALPDDGWSFGSVTFAPRTVTWAKFTVTSAKAGSPNIGLSEFEVYEASPGSTIIQKSLPAIASRMKARDASQAVLVDIKGRIVKNFQGKVGEKMRTGDIPAGVYVSISKKNGHKVDVARRTFLR